VVKVSNFFSIRHKKALSLDFLSEKSIIFADGTRVYARDRDDIQLTDNYGKEK
jgi:hypothetical protein